MAVVAALRRTRVRTARTLAVVADRAGLSDTNLSTIEHERRAPRSSTIDRLASALGVTLIPVDAEGRNTVAEASEHIARALAAGGADAAYRAALQLANDLGSATPYLRLLLAAEPPLPLGAGWDDLLAAITEWRLLEHQLPHPPWITSSGTDTTAWTPPGAILPARDTHIPEPFLRRGIRIEADELLSA